MLVKPKALQKGDTVGIIAPASPPDRDFLMNSLSFFEELGLRVKLGRNLFQEYGYLAGSDEKRVADLHTMFEDEQIKAIFCACGGYGTARIADSIDYSIIKENPKVFWGYSDITFLHVAIQKATGLVTFHGPMLATEIGKNNVQVETKTSFQQLFSTTSIHFSELQTPLCTLVEGKASGTIIGGNLSLITSTLGTLHEIDTKGKILFIEDINEEPRSIDRMLNQLLMSGKLSNASALVIGDFNECEPKREKSLLLQEVLTHYSQLANIPTIQGLQVGHCSPNIGIPLGVQAHVDTRMKKSIIESGIEEI